MIEPPDTSVAHQPSFEDTLVEFLHPPWSNRRFWLTQALVVIVFTLHLLGALAYNDGMSPVPGFAWILLLLVPVVYAGVTLGVAGSLGTAILGIVLMLPVDLVLRHTTTEMWGAGSIYLMAIGIAMLTGVASGRSRSMAEMQAIAEATAEEEQRFRLAFDDNPIAMAVVDLEGCLIRVNPSLCALLGRSADDLVGTSFVDYTHPDDREVGANLNRRLESGEVSQVRYTKRLINKDGEAVYAEIARSLAKDRDGVPRYIIASIRDLTAEREAARTVAESELRFRLAFENNMAGMVLHDQDGRFIDANEAFCRLVGYDVAELAAKGSALFLFQEDAEAAASDRKKLFTGDEASTQNVRRYRHSSGKILYVEVARSTIHDEVGNPLFTVTAIRDVTAERTLTEQLSHQALHDSLTGLPNRVLLMDRISHAQEKVGRDGGLNALFLFDLDDFKGVNDTYGHLMGDQILVAVADRLRTMLRSSDTLCRLAGDEFVYLAEDLKAVADAEVLARRIIDVLSEPFVLDNSTVERSASMGVVVWDAHGDKNAGELMQAADTAMYEAKRLGKARYTVYTTDMGERVATSFRLAQDLPWAAAHGELSMLYQPIVDLNSGHIVGWEALMRWRHPQQGWISPVTFIPLAEQNDLILKLGRFALTESLAQATTWSNQPSASSPPYIAINLSARHFHDPGLVPMVQEALKAYDFPPERLVIEITESVALFDVDSAERVINRLDRLGTTLSLDDFGTGYSSLSYLAKLHPKIIKIDRSFVSPPTKGPYLQRTLEAIISLCQALKIHAIAEGIETASQLGELRSLGCEFGQGFLFSGAVSASEIDDTQASVLRNWERAVSAITTAASMQP